MHSSIARQAIYDSEQHVVAYELLFREGCCDEFPCIDSEKATQAILDEMFINHSLVSDGLPCFVNFSYINLVNGTALQYSPKDVVIEVLETCTADTALFTALESLKRQGYKIAFDDFMPTAAWLPFLILADIVKVDFRAQTLSEIDEFVTHYRPRFGFQLLAEKVETVEEYKLAKKMGFDLFQGFQLSMPERLRIPSVA